MRYLITGGAGFIGSHLADRLLSDGASVLVLDDLSTGRFENIAHLEGRSNFELRVASVTDPDVVERCVIECQAVYHLASAVGVRLVVDEPVKTIETIVNGTDLVLRSASRYRRPVLLTSTSEVYGKSMKIPFSEGDDCVMGPRPPGAGPTPAPRRSTSSSPWPTGIRAGFRWWWSGSSTPWVRDRRAGTEW
jgi:UDP-glucose 4-epimerase